MRPKKRFAQHFLKDLQLAKRIADALTFRDANGKTTVLEIGPGTGVMTQFLLEYPELDLYVAELDRDAVAILKEKFPQLDGKIIEGDFLKLKLDERFGYPLPVIGNLPYNISGPIFFKVLDYRNLIPQAVFMIQKEVAQRVVASAGSKQYGVLSVMMQSYYSAEYLFTVPPGKFYPPPKVMSAVIRLNRKQDPPVDDYNYFRYIVKTAFNQRRKTLRNALKGLYDISNVPEELLSKRAEQLELKDFWLLSKIVK